jgi:hypothetical protein
MALRVIDLARDARDTGEQTNKIVSNPKAYKPKDEGPSGGRKPVGE